MINVISIDDEPLALQQLSTYIRRTPFLKLCGECLCAREAQDIMEREHIDAIFTDIHMPDLNGLDFVRSLAEPPIVVFTTAYSGYAVDGYKVSAVDYLLKPFGFDEFQIAANKVKRQYDLLHPAPMPADELEEVNETELAMDDSVFLKAEHRVVRVNVADISFVEGMSEYLKIHFRTQMHPVVVLMSMKKMEGRLPSALFMRIHRSYIVNLKCITEINKNRVFLGEDTALPIGDLYKETLHKYIEDKYLGK